LQSQALNARYSRETSALFYTHHSARHAPYHIEAIPPSGEAAHVIDGVLYHEADLTIAIHMLKRPGAYPRQSGLALALREIGRIERTLFSAGGTE